QEAASTSGGDCAKAGAVMMSAMQKKARRGVAMVNVCLLYQSAKAFPGRAAIGHAAARNTRQSLLRWPLWNSRERCRIERIYGIWVGTPDLDDTRLRKIDAGSRYRLHDESR